MMLKFLFCRSCKFPFKNYSTHETGFINIETAAKFHLLLMEESQDSVYNADDINYLFENL
jgi:ribosomal protein L31